MPLGQQLLLEPSRRRIACSGAPGSRRGCGRPGRPPCAAPPAQRLRHGRGSAPRARSRRPPAPRAERASARAPPRAATMSGRPAARLGDAELGPLQCLLHPWRGKATLAVGWSRVGARLRAAARADRAASGRPSRRVAAARLRARHERAVATVASPTFRTALRASSSSSTTRGSSRPGCRLRRETGGERRGPAASRRSRTESGRRSRARRGGSARGELLGPVELLEQLGDGRWRIRLEGSPTGEPPLPPYIHEPLADPGALPDGLRATTRARRPRRPPGSTSRRSCSRGSTSSA